VITQTAVAAALFVDAELPQSETSVLLNRPLRPGTDPARLSVFADDRWNLTPAFFEEHTPSISLNFALTPTLFQPTAKYYLWQLLNRENPPVLRGSPGKRLAVRSIVTFFPSITAFLTWLDVRGITRLADTGHRELDAYLSDLLVAEISRDTLLERVNAVRRLWSWRECLPERDRLPQAPPWQGEDPQSLIGRKNRGVENRTPRIPAPTIDRLLLWSLRFVQDFADDILAVRHEHTELTKRSWSTRNRADACSTDSHREAFGNEVDALLDRLDAAELSLPGKAGCTGGLILDRQHLARMLNCPTHWLSRAEIRSRLESRGLPIADAAYLNAPILGRLDNKPWRNQPITYGEAAELLLHLSTAAFVTIAYLSGARPGEVLALRRGCVHHDSAAGLWLLRGRKWKGAVDADGAKLPEGEERADPWVVVKPVADAVAVLERLHDRPLLFPTTLFDTPLATALAQDRLDKARTTQVITKHITRFINWVEHYCMTSGRDERVPTDRTGRLLYPARLRRTLAWHIVRRPRGLVAGAIQYGHVHVGVTLGYSGTYASGFPDEHAFETWLLRLEQLGDAERRLRAGEHVSGPAARPYTERVHQADRRFAGRVLTSTRQARDLLDNPVLQIHPGKGMTCVFDPSKAKCRLKSAGNDTRRTPDLSNCQPGCQNIARTDQDITIVHRQVTELTALVDDPLSPSPRREREQHELTRLRAILDEHKRTQPDGAP
jgi:integrase